ncbi:MAG: hypothetical protein PHS88_06860, partial [Candidatus Omnitrophica bacterium]|nr:hypothetical protein [Candidatus Omnitrophota bacterium]
MRRRFASRKMISALILFALFASGCAGLSMSVRDVVFEDPIKKLGIVDVEPNLQEKLGIALRLTPPAEGRSQASEETRIYARIQNGRGIEMDLKRTIQDTYRSCADPYSCGESFRLLSESTFSCGSGKIIEENEITTRGEIVRFLRGTHESKIGQFRILDWKRTPLFPETPVKLGDEWSYEETMNV